MPRWCATPEAIPASSRASRERRSGEAVTVRMAASVGRALRASACRGIGDRAECLEILAEAPPTLGSQREPCPGTSPDVALADPDQSRVFEDRRLLGERRGVDVDGLRDEAELRLVDLCQDRQHRQPDRRVEHRVQAVPGVCCRHRLSHHPASDQEPRATAAANAKAAKPPLRNVMMARSPTTFKAAAPNTTRRAGLTCTGAASSTPRTARMATNSDTA